MPDKRIWCQAPCQSFLNGLISMIVTVNCIFLESTYYHVRLNMSEPDNGQTHEKRLLPLGHQRRYTGEILLRTRPKTYRAIARELAEPNASVNGISRRYRVSNHTVMGIRKREARSIAERKNTLAAKLASVAELGAERMEETISKASLRDAAIGTGIAVDKIQALTAQMASICIDIQLPTPEEDAERQRTDRALDAIAARLKALSPAEGR